MARMRAIDAAVLVLEREGISCAFGVPGAAINPSLFRAQGARLDPPHPGPPCRGRLAHGRGLHSRQGRQYRLVHRHFGSGRHRHDHRPLFGLGGFHSDPVHHRPGAARAAQQGGLPGGRHRRDRGPCQQMGGHRHGAVPGADGAAEGVPSDALGPSRSGADRSAGRRAARRDRVRHRRLRAAAGLQAQDDAQAGRKGACHAEPGRATLDRCRRRHHQCRCLRPADRIRRDHRRAGHPRH